MKASHSTDKDRAMELAEESREKEWKLPSFTAELFRGHFRWDLMHPYPAQDAEDKGIGDAYIERIRPILEHEFDPLEVERTGKVPERVVKALAQVGAFGMKIPRQYGGLELSQTNFSRVLAVVGCYSSALSTWLSAHQSIGVPEPLKLFGTAEQKQRYLPRIARGAMTAFALTEPGVGSDPAKITTRAVPSEDGSHYILNGEKLWCTNGPVAELIVVMAKTPPKIVNGKEKHQITCFIVETSWEGFEVAHHCTFMGLKGISNGLLRFRDVKVPAENIVGEPGQGLKIALMTLNTGRLSIPAVSSATGKLCTRNAEKWCSERVQWGTPIGKHQEVAKKLANMASDTFAMEATNWLACAFADGGHRDIRLEAAIAKYFCTETGYRILDDFIQIRGGRGYETEASLAARGEEPMPAERLLRDARVMRILEGSTEIMHLIMAREALDTHFRLVMPIMNHKKGAKPGRAALIWQAAKFYSGWYPRLWLPSFPDYKVTHLSQDNRDHLHYVNKTCRRLARTIFHTMVKYQEKLEFEQLLLGNIVDIGVDLFTMAASLSYAEHWLTQNPQDASPQELADLYCRNARERIRERFHALKNNHNPVFKKVADGVLEGRYAWLYTDVFTSYSATAQASMAAWHGSDNGAEESREAVREWA
jgi:hypothetical protein